MMSQLWFPDARPLTNSTNLSSLYNNTSEPDVDFEDRFGQNLYVRLVYGILLGIIMILSVAGGFFVSYVIISGRLMKKAIWGYLLSLAISDTCSALFTIPIIIAACVDEKYLQIDWLCHINAFTMIFFGTWSIYAVTMISIHRYNIVNRPFISLAENDYWGLVKYLVISLSLSLFLAMPPLFGFSNYTPKRNRKWCTLTEHNIKDRVFMGIIVLCGYIIPLSVIIACCFLTFNVLRKHSGVRRTIRRMSSDEVAIEQKAILRTLFMVVGNFMALWTLMFVHILLGAAGLELNLVLTYAAFLLMLLQGSVNPIIYYLGLHVFEDAFRKIVQKNLQKCNKVMSVLHGFKEHMAHMSPSVRRRRRMTMTRCDTDESCVQGSLDKQGSLESNPSFEQDSSRRMTKESIILSSSWSVKKQKRMESWNIMKTDSVEGEVPPAFNKSRRGTQERQKRLESWNIMNTDSIEDEEPPPFDNSRRGTQETFVSTRSSVQWSIKKYRSVETDSIYARKQGSLDSGPSFDRLERRRGTESTISRRASHAWSMKRQRKFDVDPNEEGDDPPVQSEVVVETKETVVDTESSTKSEEVSSKSQERTSENK